MHAKARPEDEADELHVLIRGTTLEEVQRAVERVETLLRVIDDDDNEHKQKQLIELAKINGTLRESFCVLCGERGHHRPDSSKTFVFRRHPKSGVDFHRTWA